MYSHWYHTELVSPEPRGVEPAAHDQLLDSTIQMRGKTLVEASYQRRDIEFPGIFPEYA